MLLDDLVEVVETLKERISSHRDILSANEYRTRVSLIDPLLTALGWDTADPTLVTLEYVVSGKKADYALLGSDGKPIIVLEAKSLDSSLSENERMQMLNYANVDGVPFAGLTDGNRWELYSVFDQKPLSERSILKSTVTQEPTSQLSLRFLLLWRANMESGSPQPAQEPIVEVTPKSSPEPPPSRPKSPNHEWTSLTEFDAKNGTNPPQSIRFVDGNEHPIVRWVRILEEVAEHLVRNGVLTADECPVFGASSRGRCIVNSVPSTPSGRAFSRYRTLSNGLYMYTNLSAADVVALSKRLLRHFEQDPAQVWLKTG